MYGKKCYIIYDQYSVAFISDPINYKDFISNRQRKNKCRVFDPSKYNYEHEYVMELCIKYFITITQKTSLSSLNNITNIYISNCVGNILYTYNRFFNKTNGKQSYGINDRLEMVGYIMKNLKQNHIVSACFVKNILDMIKTDIIKLLSDNNIKDQYVNDYVINILFNQFDVIYKNISILEIDEYFSLFDSICNYFNVIQIIDHYIMILQADTKTTIIKSGLSKYNFDKNIYLKKVTIIFDYIKHDYYFGLISNNIKIFDIHLNETILKDINFVCHDVNGCNNIITIISYTLYKLLSIYKINQNTFSVCI